MASTAEEIRFAVQKRHFPIKIYSNANGMYEIIRGTSATSTPTDIDIHIDYFNSAGTNLSTSTVELETYIRMVVNYTDNPIVIPNFGSYNGNKYCYSHKPINVGFHFDKWVCRDCDVELDEHGRLKI